MGFTIVELLIVIVVIAILAAITIVAFNGIQARAKNQQTVAAVRAYYSAIKSYTIDNGSLPGNTGCLGDTNFYTSNPCYIGANTYTYNAALNSDLSEYVKTVPNLPAGRVENGSTSGSGLFYFRPGAYIGFPIYRTNSCPSISGATIQASLTFGSNMYCRIDLPTV